MSDDAADTPMRRHLRRRIALEGPIALSDFMADVLGHPEHGYYMTRDPFGVAGDFTTAPEISQMFGELIGLWLAELWRLMGRPPSVRLVELGPGRGTLMADALRAARMMPAFREALSVTLVETSPVLRATQARTLADCGVTLAWAETLDDVPEDGAPILAVANEFFDALPVRQLQRTEAGWRERLVAADAETGALALTLAPGPGPLEAMLPKALAASAAVGAVAELAPAVWRTAGALGARIAASGGAALVVDYGHAESALGETLQAVRRHEPCGLLEHVGEADLTAHVDFERLAEAFAGAGCRVAPLTAQGDFLRALGIEMRAATLMRGADADRAADIAAARDRLIGPEGMGTLFKVLGVAAPSAPALPALEHGPEG